MIQTPSLASTSRARGVFRSLNASTLAIVCAVRATVVSPMGAATTAPQKKAKAIFFLNRCRLYFALWSNSRRARAYAPHVPRAPQPPTCNLPRDPGAPPSPLVCAHSCERRDVAPTDDGSCSVGHRLASLIHTPRGTGLGFGKEILDEVEGSVPVPGPQRWGSRPPRVLRNIGLLGQSRLGARSATHARGCGGGCGGSSGSAD